MWLCIGFNHFDGLFGTFPYYVKMIVLTIWLEHVVIHCWALKTVLRLMIFDMLLVYQCWEWSPLLDWPFWWSLDFTLFFAGILSNTLSQRLVDFFVGWQQLRLFWGKKPDKLCVFPEVVTLIHLRKTHGRTSGTQSRDFAQYYRFIQPSSMPVFCVILTTLSTRPVYTRDLHSLFIALADGLALRGPRPSACTVASTVTHVCLRCFYRRIRNKAFSVMAELTSF